MAEGSGVTLRVAMGPDRAVMVVENTDVVLRVTVDHGCPLKVTGSWYLFARSLWGVQTVPSLQTQTLMGIRYNT